MVNGVVLLTNTRAALQLANTSAYVIDLMVDGISISPIAVLRKPQPGMAVTPSGIFMRARFVAPSNT